MTSLRARIIITLSLLTATIVAIVAGGSWWLRRPRDPSRLPQLPGAATVPRRTPPAREGVEPLPSPANNLIPPAGLPAERSVPPPTAEDQADEGMVSIAFSFAEVYGSFSNQGGFDNLERLRFLMSRAMNQWADDVIARRGLAAAPQTQGPVLYYGITTKSLSSEVVSRPDPNRLITRISTQRKEVRGVSANARFILEDLILEFVREDGVWKVDNANWSNRRVLSIEPAEL